MYQNKTIAVVVPAYNEEKLIGRVIETMPEYIDYIIVVNDYSPDSTSEKIHRYLPEMENRLKLIEHEVNQGVGGAIASGYEWCRDNKIDVAVVMAGDAQMDPDDLPTLLMPVIADETDYAKGNRLFTGDAWNIIPHVRYLGNSMMSLLTKIASGYWHVADSQCGYTAINLKALKAIHWDDMYKRYGQPNDLLVRLNINNLRVRDVPVKPVYDIGEKSGVKPLRMIPKLSWLLFKLFLYRMVHKYIIRDFHPLIFFYLFGGLFGIVAILLFGRIFYFWPILGLSIPKTNALAAMFAFMSASQFILFAMWFDMEANKHLR